MAFLNIGRAKKESKGMFQALEEKGITKSELVNVANKELAEARSENVYKYTAEDILKSKHPRKKCKLCGQKGCDVKYVGFYFHNKCLRKIRKDGKSMAGE